MDPTQVKILRAGPYSIIEFGPPGLYSVGNMDPGSISMDSIFYMTPA